MSKNTFSVPLTKHQFIGGYLYLAAEFLVIPTLLRYLIDTFFQGASDATVNFLYYLINFCAVWLIFRGFLTRNLGILRNHFLRFLGCALLGLTLYWASSIVMTNLTYALMPEFTNVNDASIAVITQDGFLLMAIGTVLLVPTAEECLFRGLMFRGLWDKGRFLAYAVSTLCFCAVHVAGYIGTYDLPLLAMCFVQYLPAGLILAWSFEKSGTIFTPILIHSVINAIGIYTMR